MTIIAKGFSLVSKEETCCGKKILDMARCGKETKRDAVKTLDMVSSGKETKQMTMWQRSSSPC